MADNLLRLFDEQVQAYIVDGPGFAELARRTGAYPVTKPMTITAKPLRIDIPFGEWPIQGATMARKGGKGKGKHKDSKRDGRKGHKDKR